MVTLGSIVGLPTFREAVELAIEALHRAEARGDDAAIAAAVAEIAEARTRLARSDSRREVILTPHDASGSLTLDERPDDVFDAALALSAERGVNVDVVDVDGRVTVVDASEPIARFALRPASGEREVRS